MFLAWQCAQQLRAAYRARDLTDGRRTVEKILAPFHTCPIPEVARLGRTLRRWRETFLAYFPTRESEAETIRPSRCAPAGGDDYGEVCSRLRRGILC